MIRLFNRKRQHGQKERKQHRSKLLAVISAYLQKGHDKLAAYMNRKTSGISPVSMKIYLCLFCLLFGSACLYVLLSSVLR